MLQCVAVCDSVMQYVAKYNGCTTMKPFGSESSGPYPTRQCVAVCCSELQCVAVCCSVKPFGSESSGPYPMRLKVNPLYSQI